MSPWLLLALSLCARLAAGVPPRRMDTIVRIVEALESPGVAAAVPELARALGGCGTPGCRAVLGEPPAAPLRPPALDAEQWLLFTQLFHHDADAVPGAVLAPDGSTVAVAPLLAGIEVGLKRATGWSDPPGVDALYAVTIAEVLATSFLSARGGDGTALGPGGCWDDVDDPQNYTLEGPPSPIPDAVANGAMDGVLLGAQLARAPIKLDGDLLGAQPTQAPITMDGDLLGAQPVRAPIKLDGDLLGAQPTQAPITMDGDLLGAQPSRAPVALADLLRGYYGTGNGTEEERPPSSYRRRDFGALTGPGKLEQEVAAMLRVLRALPPTRELLEDVGPEEAAAIARQAARDFTELYVDCPAVVPRCMWGARPYRGSPTPLSLPLSSVYIHHTREPSAPCRTFGACARALRAVQRFHQDARGWDDIGYSFLVGSDGYVYQGRGWHWVGAHTKGYNSQGYGVGYVGDFSAASPDPDTIALVRDGLLPCAVRAGRLRRNYTLRGHRQVGHTDCPGNSLFREIQTWYGFK